MKIIRIVAPHFVAGALLEPSGVVRTAPIIKYMVGWTRDKVFGYCKSKGWSAEVI